VIDFDLVVKKNNASLLTKFHFREDKPQDDIYHFPSSTVSYAQREPATFESFPKERLSEPGKARGAAQWRGTSCRRIALR